MSKRRSLPAHMRKHGPGTAGRTKVRDAKICARRKAGKSFEALGEEFKLSRERVRQIVRSAERAAARNKRIRTEWDGVFSSSH